MCAFRGRATGCTTPNGRYLAISGAGAAIRGGRFNRKGQSALYLSLEIGTAIAECSQGLAARIPPMTICESGVDCDPLADLADEVTRTQLGIEWADLDCAWFAEVHADRDPASWRLVDRLISLGYVGMIVPSFAPGTDARSATSCFGPGAMMRRRSCGSTIPAAACPADRSSWIA